MALGERLFEESGNIIGLKIARVHPVEGVTTERGGIQAEKTLIQVQ